MSFTRVIRSPLESTRMILALFALAAALGGAPGPAAGQGAGSSTPGDLGRQALSWLEQPYLTGEWGGLRSRLAGLGVDLSLTFVTDVLGNPVGGERQGLRETDNLGLDVTVDLDKLGGWTGALFQLSFSLRSGTSLSSADIGNVLNVAQVCCGHAFRLVNVALEQSLFGDALNLRGGRIAAGDDFLVSPLFGAFVQSGINGNPLDILSAVAVLSYPTATWGIRARVTPIERLYVMAGVYNADPTLGENGKHGTDWSMRGPLFAVGEVGFRLHQHPGATGLPGNYKVGGFYNDGQAPDLLRDVNGGSAALSGLPPRMHRGNAGFYILLDQMVYRAGGPGTTRGLTPFATLVVAPDASVSVMPLFVNGGLVYEGLLPSRPRDKAALGVAYGKFSDQLARAQRDAGAAAQRYELAIELTYVLQATRWLQVQPDVQYIINPGGTGRIRDALVLGFQLAVTF